MFLPLVFLLDTINFMVHVSAFQRVLRFDGLKKLQSRTHKSLQWYFCNYFYKTLTGRCRWYFLEGLIVKHWSEFIPGYQPKIVSRPASTCLSLLLHSTIKNVIWQDEYFLRHFDSFLSPSITQLKLFWGVLWRRWGITSLSFLCLTPVSYFLFAALSFNWAKQHPSAVNSHIRSRTYACSIILHQELYLWATKL